MSEVKLSKLFLECHPKDKAMWVKTAKAENMKLVEWVQKTLNDAAGHNPLFKTHDSCTECNRVYTVTNAYGDDGFCSDKCRKV